jgi:hypothetical protein
MPKQTSLDLRGEELRALWKRLPERCRNEIIALVAELIARAAQSAPNQKGAKG